jgi:hypothetical protein
MIVFAEAILVGIYSSLLYAFLSKWIHSFLILLFCVGFIKHLLGYFSGIQTIYCNYGNACKKILDTNTKYIAFTKNIDIFTESILEGILYVFFGMIFYSIFSKKWLIVFFIGFLLHFLFEKWSLHSSYCKKKCIKKNILKKIYINIDFK